MSKDQIVGLRTIDMRGVTGQIGQSVPIRSQQKRVFTHEEWVLLHTLSDDKLRDRIKLGDHIIDKVIMDPSMGLSPEERDRLSSNFRFQQEAIRGILEARNK